MSPSAYSRLAWMVWPMVSSNPVNDRNSSARRVRSASIAPGP